MCIICFHIVTHKTYKLLNVCLLLIQRCNLTSKKKEDHKKFESTNKIIGDSLKQTTDYELKHIKNKHEKTVTY